MKFKATKCTKIALTILCSSILFCGCTKSSDVVLKINDEAVTRAEYYDDFNRIKNVQFKNAPKEYQKDTSYPVLALKEKYTEDVIIRKLLNQECQKRNIEATPEEIKAKKEQVIAQIGSEEQFKNILKQNNISNEKLNSDLASEVKTDKLVNSISGSEASDSEALSYYKKNKEQFNMPERVEASHILIDVNPENIKRKITDADKQASLSTMDIDKKVKEEVKRKEALAKEVQQKASKNPKDFAKLAKEYSEDEVSAKNGGSLGYITKDSVVKEFGDAAFSQKVGTVSPLVKSQFGYHIILVTDKSAKGIQSFDKVKNDIKAFLTQQKKFETMHNLISGLKASANIEYIDESLKPENIKKQLEEAFQAHLKMEQEKNTPKTKMKELNKLNKQEEK